MKASRWMTLVAGVLVLAAGGYMLTARPSLLSRPAGAQDGESRTATIQRRDIGASVLATGVIRPRVGAEVQVGSRASGILRRLHVTVGDRVSAGQLLAELDPTEFQARVDQAAAQLQAARAERVDQAAAQLQAARAELAYAAAEYKRATQLIGEGIIARAEFDRVKRAFDMAPAQVAEAEARLRSAEIVAPAQVAEAEARLRSAEIELGYTQIQAPIAGVVAGVSTQVGETVAASFAAPTFVTIIDLDRLEVWAYVDETDIGRVAVGQTASFTVDTYPGVQFWGAVSAIQPKAEIIDNVVNYVTRLEITDRQGRTLRPEMTATVNIVIDGRGDVVAIPNQAIRRDQAGTFAWVAGEHGPTRRPIETGYRGAEYTEIVRGLDAGDVVILGTERP